jgi:hypothetical protein
MKIQLGSVFLFSSLFLNGFWQPAHSKSVSVSSVPDGAYSFNLGYPSDLSPNHYFDFRKKGNRVVGIRYTAGGPADDPGPGERICIEGIISGEKVIGSGVAVVVKQVSAKISSKSPDLHWEEKYSVKMTKGRVKKVQKYKQVFIITSAYNRAIMNFHSFVPNGERGRNSTRISSKKIPATCKSFG